MDNVTYKEWRKRLARERWERYRLLCICILISAIAHFFAVFSFAPWWLARAPRVRPRAAKVVSLRLQPRPAAALPPLKAPPKRVPKPAEKPPPERPVYAKEELDRKLSRIRSEDLARRIAVPKPKRVEEVMRTKESEARTWARDEFDALRRKARMEEEGAVGYSRVIDLKKSSDFQVGRLMDGFDMEIGYGSRKISDLNIQFTTEWLFTPGQLRNLLTRRLHAGRRAILEASPHGAAEVALRESGEGPPRPYIEPTIRAVAALVAAEEEYFAGSRAKPEEMARLVFAPVWTYAGPAFKVVSAEKRKKEALGTATPGN